MTKEEREVMRMALEALEDLGMKNFESSGEVLYKDTFTAIKEALAQPWEKFCDSNCVWTDHHPDCKLAQRKPLTDEEVNKLVDDEDWYNDPHGFVQAIEAAVWEKQK